MFLWNCIILFLGYFGHCMSQKFMLLFEKRVLYYTFIIIWLIYMFWTVRIELYWTHNNKEHITQEWGSSQGGAAFFLDKKSINTRVDEGKKKEYSQTTSREGHGVGLISTYELCICQFLLFCFFKSSLTDLPSFLSSLFFFLNCIISPKSQHYSYKTTECEIFSDIICENWLKSQRFQFSRD